MMKTLIVETTKDFAKNIATYDDLFNLVSSKYDRSQIHKADFIIVRGKFHFIIFKSRHGNEGRKFLNEIIDYIVDEEKKEFLKVNAFEVYYDENFSVQ